MRQFLGAVCIAAAVVTSTAQTPQPRRETSGGSAMVSPSVVMTSSSYRNDGGPLTIRIMVLWRGSPGWSMRPTGLGGSSSGGSPARDGSIGFNLDQGGLHLTANTDPTLQAITILGERVELKGANVVFVDRVDAPDGPVIAGTATVAPVADPAATVNTVLRDTPNLFSYLRCEQQVSESLNHPTMAAVCAEARIKGLIKEPAVISRIPTGPVTNRAALTAPVPRPERPAGPSQGSGSGVVSPAVVAGWFTSTDGAGLTTLDLLVLWRGAPGWFLKSSSSGSSGGGGVGGSRRGMTVRQGGLTLYAAFEPGPRRYQIEDAIKPLGDDNVVLADDVDSPTGPRVVKTLRIDGSLPDGLRPANAIGRSRELVTFVRCDAKLPDPRQQAAMEIICARYTSK